MNYTENYRLPQWELPDRIQMDDFNNAMASIENGLSHNTKDLRSLIERSGRDTYRCVIQQRVHHGPFGDLQSIWINPLASKIDAGGDGHGWNGSYGLSLGASGIPTIKGIRASAKEIERISIGSGATNNLAWAEFTSNGHGSLDTVWLYFNGSGSFTFTISCFRPDYLEEPMEAGPFTYSGGNYCSYPVHFPLEAGDRYYINFYIPVGSGFQGEAGFCFASEEFAGEEQMAFSPREVQPLTQIITPPDFASSAIGLMRLVGSGIPALVINGQALEHVSEKMVVNAKGNPCWEWEYRLDSLPEKMTVTLDPDGVDRVTIYDYGFIWL